VRCRTKLSMICFSRGSGQSLYRETTSWVSCEEIRLGICPPTRSLAAINKYTLSAKLKPHNTSLIRLIRPIMRRALLAYLESLPNSFALGHSKGYVMRTLGFLMLTIGQRP
jgi:hypothetical protein